MKTTILVALALTGFVMLTPLRGLAGSASSVKAGPHGGIVLSDDKRQMELALDTAHHTVDVYVLKGQSQLPDSLGLALTDSAGNQRVFELKALESETAVEPSRYHGQLDPAAQSYVGVEIRIPLESGTVRLSR